MTTRKGILADLDFHGRTVGIPFGEKDKFLTLHVPPACALLKARDMIQRAAEDDKPAATLEMMAKLLCNCSKDVNSVEDAIKLICISGGENGPLPKALLELYGLVPPDNVDDPPF